MVSFPSLDLSWFIRNGTPILFISPRSFGTVSCSMLHTTTLFAERFIVLSVCFIFKLGFFICSHIYLNIEIYRALIYKGVFNIYLEIFLHIVSIVPGPIVSLVYGGTSAMCRGLYPHNPGAAVAI